MLTSIHHWLVNPERNVSLVLIPLGLVSILIGLALLVATTAVYILGRNRMRTSSQGFSSAPGRARRIRLVITSPANKFDPAARRTLYWRHISSFGAAGIGSFQ